MSKPRAADGVTLGWVDGKAPPTTPVGTSFGVPWAQGEIDKTTSISATSHDKSISLQTWPMAYWPDGSLKWTGHSLAADSGLSDSLTLALGTPEEPSSPVSVSQTDSKITISNGLISASFDTSGSTPISSLSLAGSAPAQTGSLLDGNLVLLLQDGPDEPEVAGDKSSVSSLLGNITTAVVEQNGPVRAVIKMTGKYTGAGHVDFLPFILRFYISAGSTALRIVHFFIYDGDQTKDFIKGLGFQFETPLVDLVHDRHIRFVTDDGGIWGEPVRVVSGLRRDATAAVLTPQFEGQLTPPLSTWPTNVSSEIDQLPIWQDFTLDQLSPSHFTISKRSTGGRSSSFLTNAGFGTHASGLGYIGGAKGGGVVFALKDFWQGAPRGVDIRNAGSNTATTTMWAYSPRAPANDMRHYDIVAHGLDLTYEDVGDPDPTPIGIGRSYEMTLQVVPTTPSRSSLVASSSVHTTTPQIVASPTFYASHKLFGGRWNVPDTSTSGAIALEKRWSDLLDFYVKEVSQRQFYGFWDFGDVMHTYDQTRHTWRYDVGGYAWDNGEIATDLWLWMSFMRTGRADIFRMASNMTRHISEVDTHHTGPFAGLGSRNLLTNYQGHNVNHWGDGAKEARVAGSTLRRPLYYLTTDELIGDIMDFSLQAGNTIMTWDPLRKVFPPPDPAGPGRLRIGPDWTTLAGNWFTKWERTNDPQWLNLIKTGMNDIGSFKYGLFTGNGAAVGWNAATSHLVDEGGEGQGSYNLMMVFGGGEFLMEAMDIITDQPEFDAAWLDFCKLANGTSAQIQARYGKSFSTGVFTYWYAKLQAYAGERLNDASLKQAAWNFINKNTIGVWPGVTTVGGSAVVNPVNEIANLATNDAAGLSLTEYAVLAIAPELAPNNLRPSDSESGWDNSTIASQEQVFPRKFKEAKAKNRFKRLLCL
ncbi:Secreted protein [Mycena indigotica]|uniref:Secreted protein n=1 Tax=Mycena indigotica TaxID=2126181 RepID=A0A8H6SM64_9AGAR|nr:Secreted protein [Mycena indigotica]KAF7301879.1 Secreted protein [Mycena indigotica]